MKCKEEWGWLPISSVPPLQPPLPSFFISICLALWLFTVLCSCLPIHRHAAAPVSVSPSSLCHANPSTNTNSLHPARCIPVHSLAWARSSYLFRRPTFQHCCGSLPASLVTAIPRVPTILGSLLIWGEQVTLRNRGETGGTDGWERRCKKRWTGTKCKIIIFHLFSFSIKSALFKEKYE